MIYLKNLPIWERWARSIFGLSLAIFGATILGNSLVGWASVGIGAVALLTGFIGFCPMCAMVGRKLRTKA